MKNIKMKVNYIFEFILLLLLAMKVEGHGRLVDPPSRSSMWRYGFKNPPNYDDNQLYCGGVQVQYETNGGRCGVCGDPYNSSPRDNEAGGKYANGIIVRSYRQGETIDVIVELTANHKGYFEFHLCVNDDPNRIVDQTCFDQFKLPVMAEGSKHLKYYVPNLNGYQKLELQVQLPDKVRCRNCVFRWKYNAGNSWGVDPVTGSGCIGCGNQEQFYGCADIAIGHEDIMSGYSLKTGQMEKVHSSNSDSGMRTQTTPYTPWESMRTKETVTTHMRKGESEVLGYKDFEEFRRKFKNSHIRPCVCHSCIGNTCVCECFVTDSGAPRVFCMQHWLYLFVTLVLAVIFVV